MNYLIKWMNLPIENETWEKGFFIHKHPQQVKHIGKILFEEIGHIKPQVIAHYNVFFISLSSSLVNWAL